MSFNHSNKQNKNFFKKAPSIDSNTGAVLQQGAAFSGRSFVETIRARESFARLKGIDFVDLNEDSNYFILYNSGRLISYSKETWSSRDGIIVRVGDYLIKSTCFTRKDVIRCFNIIKPHFRPQFSYSDITNTVKGLFDFANLMKALHQAPAFQTVCTTTMSSVQAVSNTVTSVKTKAAHNFSKFLSTFVSKLFSILNITLDISTCVMTGFSNFSIIRMLVNLFLFVKDNCNLFAEEFHDCSDVFPEDAPQFESQSMESLLMSLSTLLLPKEVYEVFRRMSTFTNAKLMDDFSCFHDFYSCVIKILKFIFTYIPIPFAVGKFFSILLDKIPLGSDHTLINNLFSVYTRWKKDKTLLIEQAFVEEIRRLSKAVEENTGLVEWARRSTKVAAILKDFQTLERSLQAYEDASRVEPSCFVFEGNAGVMKSYFVNMLMNSMNETRYVHTVPPSMGGKEWWDSYNNESIVTMDDIGQQDVSQWRTIINLVSSIKYPLDCARAELKDTKYFSSSKIFVTTNNFMSIQGLTKQDGIACLPALWRRGNVFKFDVKRVENGNHTYLQGNLLFYHYDLVEGRFVNRFPKFFNNFNHNLVPYMNVGENTDRTAIVSWFSKIIRLFDRVKTQHKATATLSNAELDLIKDDVDNFMADLDKVGVSKLKSQADIVENDEVESSPPTEGWLEILKSYYNDFLSMAKDAFSNVTESLLTGSLINWTSSNWSDIWRSLLITLIPAGIFGGVMTYYAYLKRNYKPDYSKIFSNQTSDGNPLPTPLTAVMKQVLEVKMVCRDGTIVSNFGLVSGHYVIVPAHMTNDETGYITVYHDLNKDHRLLDQHRFDVVYRNLFDDVMVLRLDVYSMSPFKNLCHFFANNEKGGNHFLTNCYGVYEVSGISKNFKACDNPIVYYARFKDQKPIEFKLTPNRVVTYDLEAKGLCGSLLVSSHSGIKGMHVAGLPGVVGASVLWSDKTRDELHQILKTDKFILKQKISDKVIADFSGVKLDESFYINVPSNTNIVPSPLSGVFENTKEPAHLKKYGYHTTKDIAKKSFKPISNVNIDEIEFAAKTLEAIIPKFGEISDDEVVYGNKYLAGINKDSSNGFGCGKDKTLYFNFETISGGNIWPDHDRPDALTPLFRKELAEFTHQILSGDVDLKRILSTECLKDECRPLSKEGEPRSFRISTVHTQFLTKKLTGKMVEEIIKNRDFNQIMVGVNPYAEFHKMYDNLSRCNGVWAGDIGTWDGGMLSQAQRSINSIILSNFEGSDNDREILGFMLGLIPACPVAVQDDVYLTTHSMPSGNFLTAIYNSLVNRFYTAMWYRRMVGPSATVDLYFKEIVDYVYGDDKLNGIRSKNKRLTAITMRDFFVSIGMKLTTADKKPITEPFERLEDVSFLKRKFRIHPTIGRIMCPLDLTTIYSTMSWVDETKDEYEVMRGKIHGFQREMFLHPHLFKEEVNKLEMACVERNVAFTRLTERYLLNLYTDEVDKLRVHYGSFNSF